MSVNATATIVQLVGAFGFGSIIGWYVYYVNRHRQETVKMSDLVTLIWILGGGTVLTLFPASTDLFGAYGAGLAIGFFAYFAALNAYVRISMSDKGSKAFCTDWFLDGRCKKIDANTETQSGTHPMETGPARPPPPPPQDQRG